MRLQFWLKHCQSMSCQRRFLTIYVYIMYIYIYIYIIIYIVCIIYPDSSKLRNQTRLKKNTRNLQPCGVVWELFLYVFIPKFIGYISTSSDKLNLLLDNVWLWLKGHNWGYTPFSDTPILDPRPNRCGRLALSPEKFPGELVLGIFSMGI